MNKHEQLVNILKHSIVAEALLGKSGYSILDFPNLQETYILRNGAYDCSILTNEQGHSILVKGEYYIDILTQPEMNTENFVKTFCEYYLKES